MEFSKCFFLVLFWVLAAPLYGQDCSTPGPNLFLEGGFGAGPDNIAPDTPYLAPSGYTYTLTPPSQAGSYTITNNTSPWMGISGEDWIGISDDSANPEGYMMVVNSSPDTSAFWEQAINLCGDAYYQISFDAVNLQHPDSYAAPLAYHSGNGQ